MGRTPGKEQRQLKKDFWLAVILTLPVFVLSMGSHMGLHNWIQNTLGETVNGLIQFVLTSVVLMFPGRRFFCHRYSRIAAPCTGNEFAGGAGQSGCLGIFHCSGLCRKSVTGKQPPSVF